MINNLRLSFCFVSSILLLTACQALEPNAGPASAKKALQPAQVVPKPALAIPAAVTQDLLARPPALVASSEPRFNVSATDVALTDFFHSVVHNTPYSLVVHPSISGTISLQLKQVTLAETLAIVQSLYGFDIRRQGMVYQVYPAGLRTETIAVNYLMLQRSGFSSISVNSGGVSQDNNQNSNNQGNQNLDNSSRQNNSSANNNGQNQNSQQQFNGSTIQSESRTDFWSNLKEAVEGVLGAGPQRMVVVSPQAGLVTVRGMPAEIAAVKAFLGQSEQQLQRQVVLEAKIIEVTLSDEYQQGINWQNALATLGSTRFNFSTSGVIPTNPTTTNLGGVTAISFSNADFNGVINLLETQGNAQVLSSPRVTAMNNQKAVIKVGQDEYFVTNVTSNTTIAGTGATTTSPNISLQPFFSGIALDVTPQIDQHGNVILHVHPSVTETSEQSKTIQFSNEQIVLPLAQSNIRESDTIIKAQSGEIVVIGGLMQTVTSDSESRTPVLGAIPLLGQLFTSKSKIERKKELVILLKPTVVGNGVWQQQLQQSAELITDWYPEQ